VSYEGPSTHRIQELLERMARNGTWTAEEVEEVRRVIMPDYPESSEPRRHMFEMEDIEPVSYDKPKRRRLDELPPGQALEVRWETRPLHTHELPTSDDRRRDIPPEVWAQLTPDERRGPVVAMGITEAEAEAIRRGASAPIIPTSTQEDRIKTLEAALTDAFRRIKALEERIVDPS